MVMRLPHPSLITQERHRRLAVGPFEFHEGCARGFDIALGATIRSLFQRHGDRVIGPAYKYKRLGKPPHGNAINGCLGHHLNFRIGGYAHPGL